MASWFLLALLLWQGGTEKEAADLHEKGLTLSEQGKAEEGIAALRESLAIHKRLGKAMEQAVNLRVLAFVHEGMGERQKALGFYEQALGVLRGGQWKELEARTLRDIGVLYYNLDENGKAFAYLERSLAMQRGAAKPGVLAATLFSMGELRRYLGEKAKARALFDEAVTLAREAGDRRTEADARSSRAMLEAGGGLEELAAALAIRVDTKDRRGEASTRAKLGVKLLGMGKEGEAREELRRSIGEATIL